MKIHPHSRPVNHLISLLSLLAASSCSVLGERQDSTKLSVEGESIPVLQIVTRPRAATPAPAPALSGNVTVTTRYLSEHADNSEKIQSAGVVLGDIGKETLGPKNLDPGSLFFALGTYLEIKANLQPVTAENKSKIADFDESQGDSLQCPVPVISTIIVGKGRIVSEQAEIGLILDEGLRALAFSALTPEEQQRALIGQMDETMKKKLLLAFNPDLGSDLETTLHLLICKGQGGTEPVALVSGGHGYTRVNSVTRSNGEIRLVYSKKVPRSDLSRFILNSPGRTSLDNLAYTGGEIEDLARPIGVFKLPQYSMSETVVIQDDKLFASSPNPSNPTPAPEPEAVNNSPSTPERPPPPQATILRQVDFSSPSPTANPTNDLTHSPSTSVPVSPAQSGPPTSVPVSPATGVIPAAIGPRSPTPNPVAHTAPSHASATPQNLDMDALVADLEMGDIAPVTELPFTPPWFYPSVRGYSKGLYSMDQRKREFVYEVKPNQNFYGHTEYLRPKLTEAQANQFCRDHYKRKKNLHFTVNIAASPEARKPSYFEFPNGQHKSYSEVLQDQLLSVTQLPQIANPLAFALLNPNKARTTQTWKVKVCFQKTEESSEPKDFVAFLSTDDTRQIFTFNPREDGRDFVSLQATNAEWVRNSFKEDLARNKSPANGYNRARLDKDHSSFSIVCKPNTPQCIGVFQFAFKGVVSPGLLMAYIPPRESSEAGSRSQTDSDNKLGILYTTKGLIHSKLQKGADRGEIIRTEMWLSGGMDIGLSSHDRETSRFYAPQSLIRSGFVNRDPGPPVVVVFPGDTPELEYNSVGISDVPAVVR